MIKLPIFILMWLGVIAIKAPTWILGLVVTPVLWFYRQTNYVDLPAWTRPWANPEDWKGQSRTHADSLPKWYVLSKGTRFKAWYHYHAIRNGANGLRSFEFLDMDIVPEKVKYITNMPVGRYEPSNLRATGKKTGGYIAWQGLHAGFELMHIWSDTRHLVIKFGWRVEPRFTVDEIPDMFLNNAGFASKFLFYREG